MFNNQKQTLLVSLLLTVVVWWSLLGSVEVLAGVFGLIFIHEMGHFLVARRLGYNVTVPLFTPFGASVTLSPHPQSARHEAIVAFAGPIAGTLGSVAALALAVTMSSPELLRVASIGFVLNLFNMTPLSPLDGGGISMAIDRRLWILGAPLFAYAIWSFGLSLFNLLIALLVGMEAWRDVQARRSLAASQPQYFQVGTATRIGIGIAYVVLGAFLLWTFVQPSGLINVMVLFGL